MNESLKLLNRLARFTRLKPELFYCIDFWDGEISMQIKDKTIEENGITLPNFIKGAYPQWNERYFNGIRVRISIY